MDEPPKTRNRKASIAAIVTMAVIVAVLFYYSERSKFDDVDRPVEIQILPRSETGNGSIDLERFAVGEMAELTTPDKLEPATDRLFQTRAGDPARLADFRGRVVVVNLWATWCPPCLTEMPTLAALARGYEQRPDLLVLPINVDVPDQRNRAEAFIDDYAPLPFYTDPTFQLPFEFGGRGGMPQTILLDRRGRVRAMLTGGADWSGPEAAALIDALLAERA